MRADIMFCQFCVLPLDIHSTGTYRLVTGWVKARKDGGANAVEMMSDPQAFAHGHCVRAQRGKKVEVEQPELAF